MDVVTPTPSRRCPGSRANAAPALVPGPSHGGRAGATSGQTESAGPPVPPTPRPGHCRAGGCQQEEPSCPHTTFLLFHLLSSHTLPSQPPATAPPPQGVLTPQCVTHSDNRSEHFRLLRAFSEAPPAFVWALYSLQKCARGGVLHAHASTCTYYTREPVLPRPMVSDSNSEHLLNFRTWALHDLGTAPHSALKTPQPRKRSVPEGRSSEKLTGQVSEQTQGECPTPHFPLPAPPSLPIPAPSPPPSPRLWLEDQGGS